MQAQETAVASRESHPEKFARAAAIAILAGVGLLPASIAYDHWFGRSRCEYDDVAIIGVLISAASTYLVAPLLSAIALVGVVHNEEQHQAYFENVQQVRRASNWFLIASALLILTTLLPVVLPITDWRLEILLIGWAPVGVQMGRVSRRLARKVGLGWSWRGILLMGGVVLILLAVVLQGTGALSHVRLRLSDAFRTTTVTGSSDGLKQTMVVPTLDTPMPRRRNVIWCSSFQLAWNELRDEVIGAPLEVIGAEKIAARLNAAKQSLPDLDEQSVYANGGWVEKGICETIKGDMAAKFPAHVLPDFNDYTEGILTYSYLTAHVPFVYPFRQVDRGLAFVDSRGNETQVAGFGLWQAHRHQAYQSIRGQVEILCVSQDSEQSEGLPEYALDLCRHSTPYQVVVARVKPKGSLAETVEHIRAQVADFKRQPDYEEARWLDELDELKVPEMFWRIDHRFVELIGKGVANVGMPIVEALQTIEFRLDRSGAIVESEALGSVASRPRYFEFNRPFLVYLQKRGAERPFFVMWVDNAELLVRK